MPRDVPRRERYLIEMECGHERTAALPPADWLSYCPRHGDETDPLHQVLRFTDQLLDITTVCTVKERSK